MTETVAPAPDNTIALSSAGPSLRELMEDGIYLLFLLKDGNAPGGAAEFNRRVDQFLAQLDRNARNFGKSMDAVGAGPLCVLRVVGRDCLVFGYWPSPRVGKHAVAAASFWRASGGRGVL